MSKPAFKRYRAVCKQTGCKAEAEKLGWEKGEKTVCKNCQKCVTHCRCEAFERAESWLDLKAAQEAMERD